MRRPILFILLSLLPVAALSYCWYQNRAVPRGAELVWQWDVPEVWNTAVDMCLYQGSCYVVGAGVGDGFERRGAFLARLSSGGDVQWIKPLGPSTVAAPTAVSADVTGVYVLGNTGDVPPEQITGGVLLPRDLALARLSHDGRPQWGRTLIPGIGNAWPSDIAVGPGGVYIVGDTPRRLPGKRETGPVDPFLAKFGPDGTCLWARQFGTEEYDIAGYVAADSTGVYVAGNTGGGLAGEVPTGQQDVFLRKYDPEGRVAWTHQPGTPEYDFVGGLAVAGGRVCLAFRYDSSCSLLAYDRDGAPLWERVISASWLRWRPVALLGDDGGVSVIACTGGRLGVAGGLVPDYRDVHMLRYDAQGREAWRKRWGTAHDDQPLGGATDGSDLWLAGWMEDYFEGPQAGRQQRGFLVRFGCATGTAHGERGR